MLLYSQSFAFLTDFLQLSLLLERVLRDLTCVIRMGFIVIYINVAVHFQTVYDKIGFQSEMPKFSVVSTKMWLLLLSSARTYSRTLLGSIMALTSLQSPFYEICLKGQTVSLGNKLFLNSTHLLDINFCVNNNCSKGFILKKSKIHIRRHFPRLDMVHGAPSSTCMSVTLRELVPSFH